MVHKKRTYSGKLPEKPGLDDPSGQPLDPDLGGLIRDTAQGHDSNTLDTVQGQDGAAWDTAQGQDSIAWDTVQEPV